jgi:hypothetical protein
MHDVFAHREDDAAGDGDRRRDEERQRQQHEHLHLLHVVGDPRDERRRPEVVDFLSREPRDLVEEVAAYVAAEQHRGLRREVHGTDREADLHERDAEHDGADAPDVRGVADGDTLVDDVRVESREIQRRDGLHELQHHDGE